MLTLVYFFPYQLVVTDQLVLREPSCKFFLNKLYYFCIFSLAIFFSVAKLKTTPSMGVACRKLWAPDKT